VCEGMVELADSVIPSDEKLKINKLVNTKRGDRYEEKTLKRRDERLEDVFSKKALVTSGFSLCLALMRLSW